ncbi:MAG: hypothetical protein IJP43_05830 [Oscillospiraceae bacterium]|nr:hypothetical protein [Oscillospiraceae bacterium]
MSNNSSTNPNEVYAALKLIEQLYKDGMLPRHIYKNILLEYAEPVWLKDFVDEIGTRSEE